jgi:hypothetical protein
MNVTGLSQGPQTGDFVKPADFFRRDVQTPLHGRFLAAGAVCAVHTNCEQILEAARQTFLPLQSETRDTDFSLRLWVDPESSSQPPWPKPFVRGLDHLVFASFDSDSSILVDVRKRWVLGRFSANMASDRHYWKATIFPVLMSVIAASVGIVELHCSCVVKDNKGYLLSGPSRSGKSTLAMALARIGFSFLADDRTFCSAKHGKLSAWGVVASLKLRSEAQVWFEELAQQEPREIENGDSILRFDPEGQFGLKRAKFCEPGCLIFLDQRQEPGFSMREISPLDAAQRLEQELMAEPPELIERQRKMIGQLVEIPCWQLQYGGDPRVIAPTLMRHLEGISGEVPQMPRGKRSEQLDGQGASDAVNRGSRRSDPLRRLVPTPHAINLRLMDRIVRLETNSPKFLDFAQQSFAWYPRVLEGDSELTWRIVSQSGGFERPGTSPSGFSDAEFSFVNFGQRSFGAVDAATRSGIAFLAEEFTEIPEPRFGVHPPLEFLLYMSATSLGFTCLSAGCVAFRGRCVVLLGEPNSGKTTASYVAAKLGMELIDDHLVFLEPTASGVRAWGDPFPAVFRPNTLQFFPELRSQVRESSHKGVGFCFFDKSKLQSAQAHSVAPLCSIFLERAVAAEPRLEPMPPAELLQHLAAGLLFKECERFQSQQAAVFAGLAGLPAYRLSYDENPATAATIVRDLLVNHAGDTEG